MRDLPSGAYFCAVCCVCAPMSWFPRLECIFHSYLVGLAYMHLYVYRRILLFAKIKYLRAQTLPPRRYRKWFRAPSKAARVQCRTDPGQDGHARTRVDPVSHQGQGKRQNASSVYVDINAGPKLDPVESNGPVKRFFCRILCLTA